ncbi:sulfite reductase subunit alpha [soil metagenome]
MTSDPSHWMMAGVASVAWLVLLIATIVSALRRRRARRPIEGAPGDTLVAFASQTGMAEDLAAMTARALADAGVGARVVSFADLDLAMLKACDHALFIVATTGEGDAPDSATGVVRRLLNAPAALEGLSFGLLALGDRSYKDFCGFGRAVDAWLRRSGATPLFDAIEVDDADADAIRHWQRQLNALTGANVQPDWTAPTYQPWRLVERRLANPGSPGGEAWYLGFEPVGHTPTWQAGDIAEIGVPGPQGQPRPAARDYSIASLPEEGRIALLVRLMRGEDGTVGLASGWLTQDGVNGLQVGGVVEMRVRANSAFHGPDAARPLILIGNGTGLAGLLAHLTARPVGGGGRGGETWLMFGERTLAHDAFFDAALQDRLADGRLTRLDRVFSRDGGVEAGSRYVQSLIDRNAAEVRAWVERGAAIYVCGSLEGMASGVHEALQVALGPDRLADLTEAGLYRRDVY